MRCCAISFHSCPFSLLGGEDSGGMSVYLKEVSAVLSDIPELEMDIFTRIQKPNTGGIKKLSPRLRVVHLEGGPANSVDRQKPYDFLPEFTQNLKKFILQEKSPYDFVYSHYWLSGFAGERLKNRFGLPLVHTYHTLAFLKKRVIHAKEHKCRIAAEQHLAFTSDMIISSTEEEKSSLIGEYGIPDSKVKVIYPGVNAKTFNHCIDRAVFQEIHSRPNERVLLYVGRIQPVKGIMTMVEAFDLLRKRNESLFKDLKLVCIGGGQISSDLPKNREFARIQKAVREKKLTDKIIFLGSRIQNELKKFYSASDALVMPSLYESFGLVAVEALACGTPVIASRIRNRKDIVKEGKNGLTFCPGDPASLAACLEHFYAEKEALWDGEKIRTDIINKFSWERTAKETFQLFSGLKKLHTYPTTIFQCGESLQPA